MITNYIHGKKIIGDSNITIKVDNPSTGELLDQVYCSDLNDLNNAVESCNKSFIEWSNVTPLKRSRILSNYKTLLNENINEISEIVSIEHGKTIEDAKGSITRGIEVVEFATGIPHLLKGSFSQNVGSNIDSWDFRQPLGVCAGITPFNFPAMVPMWMYPIAIACGNTFILKPSEKNPSCSIKLAELFSEAGLPDGVLNIIHGDKEIVNKIIEHKEISSISFVGSTPVASHIYSHASKHHKRVQALGGAKNHLIVMPDADLDKAADAIIGASFGSAGERCMAVSVGVIVEGVKNSLIEDIVSRANNLKIAPYNDKDSDMGPVISKDHKDKITNYINKGVEEGANLLLDGRSIKLQGYENGYFVGPTIFDNVSEKMTIYKEEIFGPVLSLVRVKSYEDALKLVNNNKFGNGTSIFTNNGEIARDYTSRSSIGMVGVNVPIPVPMAFHSFGGWKDSIFGSHGMHGMEGIHFYTKLKTITSRWPRDISSGYELKMPTN
jgi:malonate-semialdehyde dehydrogenase (acetylating) / methylmalonate-semialdehyde dehydrogenase